MQQTAGKKGSTRLSKTVIADEMAKRPLFLNLFSSIAIMELIARGVDTPVKDGTLASGKHLLLPLLNLQLDWIKANFDCRKQALSSMDPGLSNSTLYCCIRQRFRSGVDQGKIFVPPDLAANGPLTS